jgi:hypothetical protein
MFLGMQQTLQLVSLFKRIQRVTKLWLPDGAQKSEFLSTPRESFLNFLVSHPEEMGGVF